MHRFFAGLSSSYGSEAELQQVVHFDDCLNQSIIISIFEATALIRICLEFPILFKENFKIGGCDFN